jgi:hypothetical protein
MATNNTYWPYNSFSVKFYAIFFVNFASLIVINYSFNFSGVGVEVGLGLGDGLGLGEGVGVPKESSLLQKPSVDFGVGEGNGLEDGSGVSSGVASGLGLGVGDGAADSNTVVGVFKSNLQSTLTHPLSSIAAISSITNIFCISPCPFRVWHNNAIR